LETPVAQGLELTQDLPGRRLAGVFEDRRRHATVGADENVDVNLPPPAPRFRLGCPDRHRRSVAGEIPILRQSGKAGGHLLGLTQTILLQQAHDVRPEGGQRLATQGGIEALRLVPAPHRRCLVAPAGLSAGAHEKDASEKLASALAALQPLDELRQKVVDLSLCSPIAPGEQSGLGLLERGGPFGTDAAVGRAGGRLGADRRGAGKGEPQERGEERGETGRKLRDHETGNGLADGTEKARRRRPES